MKRVSYVSRSVYQHLAEENKRLLKDLRTICMNPGIQALMLRIHYREHFRKEDKFNADLQKCLQVLLKKETPIKPQN